MGIDTNRRGATGRGHARTAALHQKQSVSIGFDSDIGASLRQYAAKIKEDALRSAAYAAARILYDEMRLNVPVKTGQLRDAIYHWHDFKQSTENRQVYAIGPSKKKAPHWALVEFGTSKMLARSYVRRAWEQKAAAAMDAAKKRLAEKLSEISGEL